MEAISKEEAWLAGIIEGEGAIQAKYQKRGRTNQVRIIVQMTDEDVIQRVAKIWGSSYRTVKRHAASQPHFKTQYAAEICGSRADSLFERIGPILSKRRQEQIKQIRAYEEPVKDPGPLCL